MKKSLYDESVFKLAERVRGRIRRLKKAGYDTYAMQKLYSRAEKSGIRSLLYPRKNITPIEALRQKSLLISFLKSESSTVRGVKRSEKRISENWKKMTGGAEISETKANEFFKMLDYLRDTGGLEDLYKPSATAINLISNTPHNFNEFKNIVDTYLENNSGENFFASDLSRLLETKKEDYTPYLKSLLGE